MVWKNAERSEEKFTRFRVGDGFTFAAGAALSHTHTRALNGCTNTRRVERLYQKFATLNSF
jgi:hypothetical protein